MRYKPLTSNGNRENEQVFETLTRWPRASQVLIGNEIDYGYGRHVERQSRKRTSFRDSHEMTKRVLETLTRWPRASQVLISDELIMGWDQVFVEEIRQLQVVFLERWEWSRWRRCKTFSKSRGGARREHGCQHIWTYIVRTSAILPAAHILLAPYLVVVNINADV
jgi:hypothetical protein